MARPKKIFHSHRRPQRRRAPLLLGLGVLLLAAGGAFLYAFDGPGLAGQVRPILAAVPGLTPRAAAPAASPLPEGPLQAEPTDIHVVDGETLRLQGQVVRLEGLQAPSRGETCADTAGQGFDCGVAAADRLAHLVANHALVCELHGQDVFRRPLAVCEANGKVLNAMLVSSGWALASSENFSEAEARARQAGRGLWADGVVPPEEWRDRR
ncbi:thermonuclease family protein [Roseomonas gilardii subsp. gilardii]|uniref:thermonuclease family protein n=1 Tax=Roseomonas gilardii TaxID=257708 RepID=UPI001FF83CEC|nr:thermonuclease family protein [Roseomonas gilardii]UPG72108.1 thermonuclease family protein [Roseomonas gilardii subsp. gilardii]